MVSLGGARLLAAISLLAQAEAQPVLQRLDPKLRVRLLAALAGFLILGFGLVALAWLGARVTRRYMNQGVRRRPPATNFQDDWASKPLVPPERPDPPDDR